MTRTCIVIAAAAAAGSLAAAVPALAGTIPVGDSTGDPSANVCVAGIRCTYVNYRNGRPADVVRRTGTITRWTVRAGSTGGGVRLRVLRPTRAGRFRFVRSSAVRTISAEVNAFPASLGVRKGDVLALTNTSSGIYMTSAPASRSVRYFNFDRNQNDGAVGRPNRSVSSLRLLLAARVRF